MAIKVNLDVLMAQKKKGLTELAKELDITKSCLTHRLKKLSQMEEDIRLHGSAAMEGTGEENI